MHHKSRERQQLLLVLAFLSPAIGILLVFTIVPIIYVIVLSFQSWDGLHDAEWIGLQNYRFLLDDRIFWLALRNTAFFTIMTTMLQIPFALFVASLLSTQLYGRTIFQALFFLPVMMSTTIVALLWGMLLEPNFGLLNETLRSLHLESLTQLWLADKNLVVIIIAIVSVWQFFGFYAVIFYGTMQNVPVELYEAGSLDGANWWQLFRFITLPILNKVIIVAIIISVINGIKSFDLVWVMTSGGPNHASEMLGTYLYGTAFGSRASSGSQLGYASSIAIVILVLSFIFSILQLLAGRKIDYEAP